MLLPILMTLTLFCINNAKRAQLKNLNPIVWILLTILSFFAGLFTATIVLLSILMYKYPSLIEMTKINDKEGINKFIQNEFTTHSTLYSLFIFAGAFGGYLLIRYLIEQRKSTNS